VGERGDSKVYVANLLNRKCGLDLFIEWEVHIGHLIFLLQQYIPPKKIIYPRSNITVIDADDGVR
jgi:hypothetical protein